MSILYLSSKYGLHIMSTETIIKTVTKNPITSDRILFCRIVVRTLDFSIPKHNSKTGKLKKHLRIEDKEILRKYNPSQKSFLCRRGPHDL